MPAQNARCSSRWHGPQVVAHGTGGRNRCSSPGPAQGISSGGGRNGGGAGSSTGAAGSFSRSRCARNPTAQRPPQVGSGDAPPQPLGGEPGERTGLTHAEMQLALLMPEGEQHTLGGDHFGGPGGSTTAAVGVLRRRLRAVHVLARFGGWVG
ncbi:hypothetical protein I3W98_26830 [Streptomyces cavourensis]|nr:hypothetical protein [Streptomyces cavourensis]